MAKQKKKVSPGNIAQNKKVRHDYFIEQNFEAGLSLMGWEVKSLRAGRVQLNESYVLIKDGQPLGEIRKSDHTKAPGAEWQADGSVRITTTLHGPHSFVLEARSANVAAH